MKLKAFISVMLCAAFLAASCSKDTPQTDPSATRKVFLLYSAGYNNLSVYLYEDIEALAGSQIPYEDERNDYSTLVFSHQTVGYYDYVTPSEPVLVELYRKRSGEIVRDTLVRYPSSTVSAGSQTLRDVLNYVRDNYPAREYGMLFSSHATGWLPQGYYSNGDPKSVSAAPAGRSSSAQGSSSAGPSSYSVPLDGPLTKTIGAQFEGSDYTAYEIEIADFAAAIPMHLKYILLDCCLSGGAEVAWQLRDVADYVVGTQTEIMASGYVYENIMDHVRTEPTDVQGICEDVYNYYDEQTGVMRSCTISMISTASLPALADVCSTLFEKYRSAISAVNPSKVQSYFRLDRHYFYDLKDILVQSGISAGEVASLQEALDACVTFHGNTPSFMNTIALNSCCGLSMYLPCQGTAYLDNFYKTLGWNKATALVK